MNYSEYYYKNGCTICGGEVTLDEETFIYTCTNCGAFANSHRKDTEFCKKFEPYQYLASGEINELRKSLESVFSTIWHSRVDYQREKTSIYSESIINIIFPENIRSLDGDELLYVKVINKDKENNTCDVFAFDIQKLYENIVYSDLKPVSNRGKAYVWLAIELGIKVAECKIGYLSESQLKEAIQICSKHLSDARRKAIESYQRRT